MAAGIVQPTLSDTGLNSLLLCSLLVFAQQIGFASLEVGNVRAKNARNILLKNVIDKLACGSCYWAFGYAFAYGTDAGGFIGHSNFFLSDITRESAAQWIFSWVFLATATTIVSGCIAERAQFEAYLAYTPLMSVLVYPLVVHWTVSGWLTTFAPNCKYLDFAGGSTVHLLGGVAGLVAAWVIGPRIGRFDTGDVKPIVGHDVQAMTVGTLFLWFGWYGFNIAPSYLHGQFQSTVAARAAVNTTLAGCAGSLAALLVTWWRTSQWDLRICCNGVLAGMVSITALCPHVEPWAAYVIGCIAGVVYLLLSALLVRLKIDDPLDASAVHAGCALVGLIGLAVFAKPEYLEQARTGETHLCGGFLYTSRGGEQLGVQLVGIVVITAFTASSSFVLFYTLKRMGRLRVDQATEIAGIDNIDHGGPAYPDFAILSHE